VLKSFPYDDTHLNRQPIRFLKSLDLRHRCPRYNHQPHVARRQVHDASVDMIRKERAARTTLFPPWAKHEVVNNQLASTAKEVGKRLLSAWPLEHILLLDFLPRQLAPLPFNSSRSRVNSFSLPKSSFRAASHSACDTTLGSSTLVVAVCHDHFSFALHSSTIGLHLRLGTKKLRENRGKPARRHTPATTNARSPLHTGHMTFSYSDDAEP